MANVKEFLSLIFLFRNTVLRDNTDQVQVACHGRIQNSAGEFLLPIDRALLFCKTGRKPRRNQQDREHRGRQYGRE